MLGRTQQEQKIMNATGHATRTWTYVENNSFGMPGIQTERKPVPGPRPEGLKDPWEPLWENFAGERLDMSSQTQSAVFQVRRWGINE